MVQSNSSRRSILGYKMRYLPFLLISLAISGCSSTPGGMREATSSQIGGVEVWKGGTPPRPYHVIATIHRVGADQSASYAQEEESIAGDATSQGADAVIILDEVMAVSRLSDIDGRPITAPKIDAELIKY